MNKMSVAGAALLMVAAVAVPVAAWPAGDDQTTAPAASDQAGGGPIGQRGWMRPGIGGEMRPGMHARMMNGAMQRSPRQACLEHLARRAGFATYIGAKLNLTAEQQPLWDKLQATIQPARDTARQLCAGLQPAQQTVLDRMSRHEQMLSAKLQAVKQAEPAMQALYQTLTSEQKAILDHPSPRG